MLEKMNTKLQKGHRFANSLLPMKTELQEAAEWAVNVMCRMRQGCFQGATERLRKALAAEPAYVPAINYKRHPQPINASTAVKLDELQRALYHYPTPSRNDVAQAARAGGLGAYIGGHHVAIHEFQKDGMVLGSYIAIITGNFGDWL